MADKKNLPNEISYMIMARLLRIINHDLTGLDDNDPTKLHLVEIRPRSEEFADMILSCAIATNDPDSPNDWEDREITKYPVRQNAWGDDFGRNFNEIGGGQGFERRFTLTFNLYFSEMNTDRDTAIRASRIIMSRIHRAIIANHLVDDPELKIAGLRDDFGNYVISSDKAVKSMETIPAGSMDEVSIRGKMRLSFMVYNEP